MPTRQKQVIAGLLILLGLAGGFYLVSRGSQANQAILVGDSRLLHGDLEEALRAYDRAVTLAPQSWRAHSRLGRALDAVGRYPAAAQQHRQALRLAPEEPEALLCAAQSYIKAGQAELAESTLRHVLRNDPASFEALLLLSRVEQALGRNGLAQRLAGKVIELNPYHYAAYGQLAFLQEATEPDQAVESLLHCLNSGPSPEWQRLALLELVRLYLSLARSDEAVEAARRLDALYPGSPEAAQAGSLLENR